MICPRCFKDETVLIDSVTKHYLCNNPNCVDENGSRTQFMLVPDAKINFPYNQIFVNRDTKEFYRKPYLVISEEGNTSV